MSNQYPQFPGSQQPPVTPETPKKPRRWPWVVGLVVAFLFGLGLGAVGETTAEAPVGVTSKAGQPTATVTAPGRTVIITPSVKQTQPPSKSTVAPTTSSVACAGQEDRNAPCVVTVGEPFELGKHQVLTGWKVVNEFDLMSITGKAKNTSGEASTMFISIKFLRGDDVVAVVDCSTDELEPGQTQAMSCYGGDPYTRKYDKVTAEATF